MSRLPLDGILVADFSRVLAGLLTPAMLADLDPTVIKVERPGSSDDTRAWRPSWTDNSSPYFGSANRSKKSVVLDLDDLDDLVLAQRLAARADVLAENARSPGRGARRRVCGRGCGGRGSAEAPLRPAGRGRGIMMNRTVVGESTAEEK